MNPQQTPPLTFPHPSKKPLIAAVVLGILLVVAVAFGYWAFSGRQDYKNNTDKKVAAAVASAKESQAAQLQAQYDQLSKSPYATFNGPEADGSINFKYPKTWGAYVDETSSSEPIDGYFYPGIVPGIQSNTAFALRVELTSNDYQSVVDQFQGGLQSGSVTASAYLPPKMKNVSGAMAGLRVDGTIAQDSNGNPQNGSMVILKVRDQTLQIYTLSPNYLSDFNNIVLANLAYKP